MQKLTRNDLFTLEKYAEVRADFRQRVMAHKKPRRIAIGPHVNLYFEDQLTMQYQIQEMLRVERIFEAAGIDEELLSYNPLIPDGGNLKATLMIEYADVEQRRQALAELKGLENKVWMQVAGFDKIWPIADEDLARENTEKTSAVHFLRFEFSPVMIDRLKNNAVLSAGVEHAHYHHVVESLAEASRQSLIQDFD